jgi:hypothetical protein
MPSSRVPYRPKKSVPLADVAVPRRALSEADAIEIWHARWLRIRPADLIRKYGCDPRRLYEIWEETTFKGSRAKALARFVDKHPGLLDRVNPGAHLRRPLRAASPDQLSLF